MNKLKKTVPFVLALIIALSMCVLFPVSANADSWKSALNTKLDKYASNKDINSYRFWLIDFDNDGIPEIVMKTGYSGYGMYGNNLIAYNNGDVQDMVIGGDWRLYQYKNNLYVEGYRHPINAQWEYYQAVIEINKSFAKKVFTGQSVSSNKNEIFDPQNPSNAKCQYYINDGAFQPIGSYSLLQKKISEYVDVSNLKQLDNSSSYTISQVRTAIQNYKTDVDYTPNVTLTNTASGVRANWQHIPECFAYDVYYKKDGAANWTHTNTQDNSFTVPNSQSGMLYYVQVKPTFGGNVPNYYSKVKSMTYIAQPTITGLSYNGNNTLTWNNINGANKYQIARKKTGDTAYTYFTTTATSFTEKNISAGVTYTYQVRAMYETANNGTAYGAWSGSKSVETIVKPVLTLSNKSNGIRAEWNAISGAAKYIVYYRRNADSNWSSVTTYNNYYPLLGLTA